MSDQPEARSPAAEQLEAVAELVKTIADTAQEREAYRQALIRFGVGEDAVRQIWDLNLSLDVEREINAEMRAALREIASFGPVGEVGTLVDIAQKALDDAES